MSIEAMKQALELAREGVEIHSPNMPEYKVCAALLAFAEQAEKQEPVALQMDVIVVNLVRAGINKHHARELAEHFIKHTTQQPQREWVGLTNAEIADEFYKFEAAGAWYQFAHAIEAKLKEKNT